METTALGLLKQIYFYTYFNNFSGYLVIFPDTNLKHQKAYIGYAVSYRTGFIFIQDRGLRPLIAFQMLKIINEFKKLYIMLYLPI